MSRKTPRRGRRCGIWAIPTGFAAFDVDPGTGPGGTTRLVVTYYNTVPSHEGTATTFERFTLVRKRSDAAVSNASGLLGMRADRGE